MDFTSVSTQQINFLIPAEGSTCNGTSSYIDINGQQFPLTFTYDPTLSPLVSQLSLTSASPVLKQSMVITGSNFGDLAHTQVFLYDVNETQQYELTVQSVTSTTINVILGGGKSGEYNVRVLNKGVGLSFPSPASQFSYRIYVESVTPATGSMGGGFDITITGRNFATADSTNVFVGSAMNSLCTITSITATTIVCTLPPMDSTYTGGAPQNITVTGRAVEESECAGECTFTFNPAVTNNVTQLATSEIDAGTSVFVSGFNLTGATVTVGGKSATVTNVAADNLTFTYPPLTAGSYDILIKVGNAYAYPPLPTVTNLWLGNGISTSSGSYAGHILTVAGNGMTTTINDNNVFTIRCPVGGIIPLVRLAAAANFHTF